MPVLGELGVADRTGGARDAAVLDVEHHAEHLVVRLLHRRDAAQGELCTERLDRIHVHRRCGATTEGAATCGRAWGAGVPLAERVRRARSGRLARLGEVGGAHVARRVPEALVDRRALRRIRLLGVDVLVWLARALKALDGVKTANPDQKAGVDIVRRAIQVPARQIIQNAGEDGSLVVGKLLESSSYSWGFNAATGEYQDLVKAGVIDPAKVVRTALQDAASVASLLITTEALVADRPKKAELASTAAPPMDF